MVNMNNGDLSVTVSIIYNDITILKYNITLVLNQSKLIEEKSIRLKRVEKHVIPTISSTELETIRRLMEQNSIEPYV